MKNLDLDAEKMKNRIEGMLMTYRTVWDVEYCKKNGINQLEAGDTASIPRYKMDGTKLVFPEYDKKDILKRRIEWQCFNMVNKKNGAIYYSYAPIVVEVDKKNNAFYHRLTPEYVKEQIISGKFSEYIEEGYINNAIEKWGIDNFEINIDQFEQRKQEDCDNLVCYAVDAADEIHGWYCYNRYDVDGEDDFFFNVNAKHAEWLTCEEGKKWLKEFRKEQRAKNGKKGGKASKKNHTKAITIKCKANGCVFEFDTYKECMEYLCMKSNHTFCEFLEGNSKYNKIYEIMP